MNKSYLDFSLVWKIHCNILENSMQSSQSLLQRRQATFIQFQ